MRHGLIVGAIIALTAASLALAAPPARATSLDEAISLALKHDPDLRRAQAQSDAARARLSQARAAGLPSVTILGEASDASTDFGPFFGFGRHDLAPRSARIAVEQPLYTGGAVRAGIGQARAGDAGARALLASARHDLIADVAEAFEGALIADQDLVLRQNQVAELTLIADQAASRFHDGEVPSTDVDQARARLAEAQAGLARAQGDQARARARYERLVGEAPRALEPPSSTPMTPTTLDDAVAEAQAGSPAIMAAKAAVRAAEEGVSRARAEGLPSVSLVAQASTMRDEFLPGYRADGESIGVQGRWALFDGGRVSAKVAEARAKQRDAEAALDAARDQVREDVIDAWQAVRTAGAVAEAAAAQSTAAGAALTSVREEVRVAAKPTIDLLDAEREALAARTADLRARGARLVAAYRLNAVLGREQP